MTMLLTERLAQLGEGSTHPFRVVKKSTSVREPVMVRTLVAASRQLRDAELVSAPADSGRHKAVSGSRFPNDLAALVPEEESRSWHGPPTRQASGRKRLNCLGQIGGSGVTVQSG
jgi:hypothetical protein